MKRVLFLAYLYPPIQNSGSQRPLKFSNYLPDFGWEPIILTADPQSDMQITPDLLTEIRPGTQIIRVKMASDLITDRVASLFPPKMAPKIRSGIAWRICSLWDTPDIYAPWKPTVIRTAMRMFKRERFDAIFATGFPWTSLLAGRDIARLTKTPLIADFRDPWTADDLYCTNLPKTKERKNRAAEHSVLKASAFITTTTESLSQTLANRLLSPISAPIVTIENGYDHLDFVARPPKPKSRRKRIVYAGVWKGEYGPKLLYKTIAALKSTDPLLANKVEIVGAGYSQGPAEQMGIQDLVTELGVLSHRDAIALISSADLLYLPMPIKQFGMIVLPGKLFEYAATTIPIIAVAAIGSECERISKHLGGVLFIPETEPERLYAILLDFVNGFRVPVSPPDPVALAHYSRKNLTRKLANILDTAVTIDSTNHL